MSKNENFHDNIFVTTLDVLLQNVIPMNVYRPRYKRGSEAVKVTIQLIYTNKGTNFSDEVPCQSLEVGQLLCTEPLNGHLSQSTFTYIYQWNFIHIHAIPWEIHYIY